MVKFLLVLEVSSVEENEESSEDTQDNGYEGFIKKTFEMPTIPRIGEWLRFSDWNLLKVTGVEHVISEGITEIHCGEGSEFEVLSSFIDDEQGWKYESGSAREEEIEDKKRFYQATEVFKARRAEKKDN